MARVDPSVSLRLPTVVVAQREPLFENCPPAPGPAADGPAVRLHRTVWVFRVGQPERWSCAARFPRAATGACGWPVIPIDAGNQVRRFGRQAEIKFQITFAGLRKIRLSGHGLWPHDLRLPSPELIGVIAPSGDEAAMYVAANATVLDLSSTPTLTACWKRVARRSVSRQCSGSGMGNSSTTAT